MLKVTFPLLALLLIQASKTKSQEAVMINNVKIQSGLEDAENIKEGRNITLTCSANIVIRPDLPSQVFYLFYKGRNKDFLLKRIILSEQESHYTIQSARASHSGYYHCVVEAGNESKESETTFIKVAGKLRTPVLAIQPMNVTIGDIIELRCTSEEIPPLTFIFFKYKNRQRSSRLTDKSSNTSLATYQLRVTTNTEKSYSCNVQGNDQDSASNHSQIVHITVQDPFPDPVFEIEPSDGIFEGDNLTIKCRVRLTSLIPGVKPQLTIVKGTTPIDAKATADFAVEFSRTATTNDKGEYKCNANWKDALKSTKRQVTVAVPVSKPTLKSKPTDGNVVKDGTLSLSCAVLKGSRPITYKFYKDTSEAPLQEMLLNGTEAVYHIIAVNSEHSGKYSCEASNTADQKTQTKKSQYITITVKVPVSNPTIKLNSLKDVYKTGEQVTLHCHSTNGTIPITYSLFLNKRFIYSVSRYNTEPAVFNVLINETKDGGEYKCKAENEIPNLLKYSKEISFTVKVPVSMPLLYPLVNSTEVKLGETVTLHCITSTGTLPITYTLYWNQSSLQSAFTTQAAPAVFNITVETMAHSGEYRCKAENQISSQRSNGISFHVLRTQWWSYVAPIVSLVAIIVAVVIILSARCIKQQCQNKNGTNQEDESCSYETHQRESLQPNQGSLKESIDVVYCKVGKVTHSRANSDRDHEGDYTNILTSKEADSESECEGDYMNVTSKRNAANADISSSSDENDGVLYTQLDLAAPQNNNMPQSQVSTLYACIALNKLPQEVP
ncbi:platelet endothelial cell adhesion molecule-like isoform X2 [Heterodontus francisci]|uniref:platelet endothelial cell adhesion molecule-like isoform X2 n=1 Tax=Heterodontus francisci TaxID=7792 RepID=UPI00355C3B57